ncbi:hypothetical protein CCUG60885_04260 [Mycobacteroides salmoniphilum]|uniref:Glycosyltransferase family 25 (LPS biosynthesis protein) n=1 Tax=Mycobacteroides salmoniphilum TaxID=404941 RepID=A0A4R8SC24_9MYCO|nr:hypothetical protein CCUG60885_04260 [Mycobacteroides salmoniphilum]TEA07375.1 hypothetical protein CCUG60883_01408 [Mycobacteroides salmoniphilum]
MTDYRIGIVAHTQRATAAHELMDTAGAAFLSMDNGTLGCDRNHRRTLEWLAKSPAEWGVVLEDDAIPCEDWSTTLTNILDAAPAPIVSFYLGINYPKHWQPRVLQATQAADAASASWIVAEGFLLHAVGYAIRTELIDSALDHNRWFQMPVDQVLTDWARNDGHKVAYTWPSIVQHDDGPTLFQHPDGTSRTLPRVAHRFGVPQQTPRSVLLCN